MKRFLILIGALLAFALPSAAQTVVSGTITDTNSIAYNNAQVTAFTITPQQFTTFADVTGKFQFSDPLPAGTYTFVVSGPGIAPPLGIGRVQFTVNSVSISGTTQSVTATLSAAAPSLLAPGISFGGGSPGGSNGQIQYNNSGAFGGISVITAGNGGTGFASYTKADLLCPSGTTTFTKLGVGSDGQVLTADSASACGLKYAASTSGLSGMSANCLPKAATATTITGCSLATDNGTTLTYTGTGGLSVPKVVATGSGAGAFVATAGSAQGHGTASTVTVEAPASVTAYEVLLPAAAGTGCVYGTNGSNVVTGTFSACPIVVWSGTVALNTAAISSASHNLTTANHSGILTTDFVSCVPNGSLNAVTGYVPSTSGTLGFYAYPTADNLNIDVINNTTGSITPGAVTLNCAVTR